MTMTLSPPLGPDKVRITNRPDPQNVWRLNRGIMPMVCEMERIGMRLDTSQLGNVRIRVLGEMESLHAQILKSANVDKFNPGSPDQLSDLLFHHLKLKQNGREKWTKNRARLAADADVLKAMVSQHPCIKMILDWKERKTIHDRYTTSLAAKVDENSRVHSDISLTTAETNRLASSDPNLQNIPTRTALGVEIRKAFVTRPGNKIGSVDASQIEMRMNAVDAQCVNLLGAFWGNEDVYWQTAEIVDGRDFPYEVRKSEEKIYGPDQNLTAKKWFRQNAKIIALMVGYDASPAGVYDQFLSNGVKGWTEKLVELALVKYFKGYPELLQVKKMHYKRAYQHEFIWDMWGFIRWIPQVRSVHKRVVAEGLRQAGNLAGQGGAAGIIKLWMAIIWKRYEEYWKRHGIEILMQVHDELLFEGPESPLKDCLEECAAILRGLLPYDWFNCPLDANWSIADNWGEAKD